MIFRNKKRKGGYRFLPVIEEPHKGSVPVELESVYVDWSVGEVVL